MITAWIIGFLSSILDIILLKNIREKGKPVLVMWFAIVLGTISVIPIANIAIGIAVLLSIGAAFLIEEDITWKCPKEYGKLGKFLHGKIS